MQHRSDVSLTLHINLHERVFTFVICVLIQVSLLNQSATASEGRMLVMTVLS